MSHQEGKDDLSDYTADSTTTYVNTPSTAPTPGSPVHHRTGYRRLASFNDQDTAYHGPQHSPKPSRNLQEHGLGIKNLKPLPSPSRAGLGSPETPGSRNALLSPPLVQSRREYKPVDDQTREDNGDWDDYTSRADSFQPFVADSETERLHRQTTAPTVQSFEPLGMAFNLLAIAFGAVQGDRCFWDFWGRSILVHADRDVHSQNLGVKPKRSSITAKAIGSRSLP